MNGLNEIRHPVFSVIYEKKDITKDLTPHAVTVSFTDYLDGQSDEVTIVLEDVDQRWLNAWYPKKGDRLTVQIGYQGDALLSCGQFEIDEIEVTFSPSIVTIKGLATGIKKDVRTKNGVAYENTSLAAIAQRIAARHSLSLVGAIRHIQIDRVTQFKERDVAFLKRIAKEYGYVFKITNSKLVFSEVDALHAANVVTTYKRTDITSGTLRDKVHMIYGRVSARYHDHKTKKVITYDVQSHGADDASADTLKISSRSSSSGMSEVKAKAALKHANVEQTTGTIKVMGNVKLVAGCKVALTECGHLNGEYIIDSAHHQLSRDSGYITEIEIKRVGKSSTTNQGLSVYDVKANQIVVVGTSPVSSKKRSG